MVGPVSGVEGSLRGEYTTGIAPPTHETERAALVTDRELGEVAPPSLGRLDLILLPLAGGRDHRHLDPTLVINEAGCQHPDRPPARDFSGWPAKA